MIAVHVTAFHWLVGDNHKAHVCMEQNFSQNQKVYLKVGKSDQGNKMSKSLPVFQKEIGRGRTFFQSVFRFSWRKPSGASLYEDRIGRLVTFFCTMDTPTSFRWRLSARSSKKRVCYVRTFQAPSEGGATNDVLGMIVYAWNGHIRLWPGAGGQLASACLWRPVLANSSGIRYNLGSGKEPSLTSTFTSLKWDKSQCFTLVYLSKVKQYRTLYDRVDWQWDSAGQLAQDAPAIARMLLATS